jgi:large subunit ribosomal protein L31
MNLKIHPKHQEANVKCACGHTFAITATFDKLQVDVCSQCHPFYTGQQRFVDSLGRVDKFVAKRQAASGYSKKAKTTTESDKEHKSLKDILGSLKTND